MRGRKEADPFYGTTAWKRARAAALDRDGGLCVRCREMGRYHLDASGRRWPVLADMVHHIIPRTERPELELTLSNLMSLCDRCHAEVHPEKLGGAPGAPPLAVRLGIRVEGYEGARKQRPPANDEGGP